MIFAPYAVVLIGAHEGIMLANFLGTLMPVLLLPRSWSQIEWHKVWWLSLPAVAVMPAPAWVSSISPPGPSCIVVALLELASLRLSVALVCAPPRGRGPAREALPGLRS